MIGLAARVKGALYQTELLLTQTGFEPATSPVTCSTRLSYHQKMGGIRTRDHRLIETITCPYF